jgi:hypothetical protein
MTFVQIIYVSTKFEIISMLWLRRYLEIRSNSIQSSVYTKNIVLEESIVKTIRSIVFIRVSVYIKVFVIELFFIMELLSAHNYLSIG